MSDKEMDAVLREWLQEAPAGQPDRSRVVGTVVSQLRSARPRRRRWLPSTVPGREAVTPAISPGPVGRPSPTPASDGHTPTVIGRTQTMLSPAKAIAAGALVFAIGGALLIAQPFDQQGAGQPGAATGDPRMAPSFFSVATDDWVNAAPVTERRGDGVVMGTGECYTVSWDANDPRMTGTARIIMNETDYREGATTLAPTGDVGTVRSGLLRVANEEGSWEGPFTLIALEIQNVDSAEVTSFAGWLSGTGGYEGLSAYVFSYLQDGTFWGHITSEGPPPVPENLPE